MSDVLNECSAVARELVVARESLHPHLLRAMKLGGPMVLDNYPRQCAQSVQDALDSLIGAIGNIAIEED